MVTDRSFPLSGRFDRFEVDLNRGELRKEGVGVAIQEQPFQVLRMLLQAEGEVVTREQLCAALWPKDTFVDFEHGINTAVKKLRQALEDSAERPRFVETLPRIGYRFMVPVEWANSRHGMSLLPNVVPIAPPETLASLETVPPKRAWKLSVRVALAALGVIACAFFVRRVLVGHSEEPLPNFSQRRLTANPHDAPLTSGVISPDGKYLAYSDPTGLYLRQVDSGETISVPLPKELDAMPESWFPDSVHLVVSHFDDLDRKPSSLWKISVVGGTPRKLADAGLSARVSPDGSKIVFLRGQWDDEEIWLINTDTNTTTRIVDGGGDHFGPIAWAPDGKRFACIRMPDRFSTVGLGQRIEVFDATTGKGETILSDFRLGEALAWPENRRLIYALQEAPPNDGNFNLWSVHLDSHTGRPYGSATRITNDQTPIAGVSVTSDGKRLALLRREFQSDVYVAELMAQGKQLSPLRRFTLDDRDDWPSAWTPDSKAVLFVSNRDGPNHIFRQSIDAAHPELLVGGKDGLGFPELTPDGLSALYLVYPSSGKSSDNSRLMRVALAGGSSQLAFEEPGIGGYKCARLPSTLCIYSRIDNGVQRFFVFDPAGGKGRELSAAKRPSDDGPGSAWSLSPDGRYLASPRSANPQDASALRILDLTSGKEREISLPGPLLIMGIDWAPDNRSLWVGGYMGRSGGGTRSGLLRVDLAGRVRTMLEGSSMAIWFAIPSPDGRRLAILAHTDDSNVSLLENF
ncbi:MAG TPA: winged helix-turn-helix domain-containing protein [Alloacidobacterium sp.]|nr:winged helix-turn-helix domain-containing protein [Alloacidobacterium sp.]